MEGKSRISGHDVLTPTPRQVAVAKVYVEGLERDRRRLSEMVEEHGRVTWELVQGANYNHVLHRALADLLSECAPLMPDDIALDAVYDLLDDAVPFYETLFTCPCGHSKFEHDDGGCTYLHCKPICVTL